MKSCLVLLLSAFYLFSSSAQENPIPRVGNHEIGVDAAPFITQFLSGINPSTSGYSLLYRYHFDKTAIRARVGGNVSNYGTTTNDTIQDRYETSWIRLQAGLEKKLDFKKRWQFFYGIDAIVSFNNNSSYREYGEQFTAEDYSKTQSYGLAPIIGFRFKINERISISTESSFAVNYSVNRQKRVAFPQSQHDQVITGDRLDTRFIAPTFLFFTFSL